MEMTTKSVIELSGAIGAGGVCVILMVWIIVRFINSILPRLSQIGQLLTAHQEIVKNNTEAIHELSRSNDNVAKALSLLENTTKQLFHLFSHHDARSEKMEAGIVAILETTRECIRGKK